MVEAVSPLVPAQNEPLSPKDEAGVVEFAMPCAVLLTLTPQEASLPAGYGRFSFPEGEESAAHLCAKDAPLYLRMDWRSARRRRATRWRPAGNHGPWEASTSAWF
ncbi:hypothetical protein [Deinococcus hopiensis]|uniref:Uncharacterized protein n=1 Tax=Deinococcus hopiensis KR-140 TaxID=695939 RepID=A0A1W1V8Y5_9DEIO|nr:hypothetical protein [Deinococcus hopiensis]SMB89444.1 hypothetical protein SAMN00790413_00424 [Deinococcus hopiensis KR-140]